VRRFLGGVRIERAHPIAKAREPDAEVGVLGDVPFVPGADVDKGPDAEVIGAAAERNRQVEGAEARIDEIEQRRIFDRKLARERNYVADSTSHFSCQPAAIHTRR
jgi:hypothetical protein